HMTQDEYEAGLARLMGDDEAEYPADGLSELDDGTPVPPMAGAYLSLIGAFRRIVFGADDEIVSYSKERGYTPVQRAALGAKNRRCCHPYGCDRNGRALQADHIREYSDGGRTHLHNGQCLCGFHNRWKNQHKGDPPRTTRRDRGARRARGPDLC
ncbi:MAG TPA: HNH endonuclease signature motif containing protein, partial [Acidimicrobiales bacterium]|nr:HNH endonuclease signature motif containing protein [Acidimicrobiales bacterium]